MSENHILISNFFQAAVRAMPDVPSPLMQWWIDHPQSLQQVLAPLANKPKPSGKVIGVYDTGFGNSGAAAVDRKGNCWVCSYKNYCGVLKVSPDGAIQKIDLGLNRTNGGPTDIAMAPDGTVWVAVWGSGGDMPGEIFRLNPDTGAVQKRITIGGTVNAITVDPRSGEVWATNRGDNKVYRFSSSGANVGSYSVGVCPTCVHVDAAGNAWCPNMDSHSITRISPAGVVTTTELRGQLSDRPSPTVLVIDGLGNVWVGVQGGVCKLDPSGKVLAAYPLDGNPGTWALGVDSANNLWAGIWITQSVYKIGQDGKVSGPYGTVGHNVENRGLDVLVVDSNDTVWVTDMYTGKVRWVTSECEVGPSIQVGQGARYMATSGSGNLWVVCENSITQLAR